MFLNLEALLTASQTFAKKFNNLEFSSRVAYVYNPLAYAWKPYRKYLTMFGSPPKRALFFGMNPGPWGMAQTGVPFGEVNIVREWLGIEEPVEKPHREHPKRPVTGFDCSRSEVSGLRLWGLFKKRFGTPENFFKDHFVGNYCPLLFFDADGKNLTPDKLIKSDREETYRLCDEHAAMLFDFFRPEFVIGIGAFAVSRLNTVQSRAAAPRICSVLHPSPASPKANRGWAEQAVGQLEAAGVW